MSKESIAEMYEAYPGEVPNAVFLGFSKGLHQGRLGNWKEAAAYLYRKLPSAAELEATGFTREDEEDIDLQPENEQSVMFFAGLGAGAWNHSMNGPCGLRYESLPFLFEMSGIQKKNSRASMPIFW